MKCPLCVDQELVPNFRAGIEIDVCPQCRGVWLDRGELDKLANAPDVPPAAAAAPTPAPTPAPAAPATYGPPPSARDDAESWDRGRGGDRDWGERPPKRKKAKKRKGFADRLADALDDVLDL